MQERQEVALVVGGTTRVDAAIAQVGLERVRVPLLDRRDALHVVVAVDQDRRRVITRCAQLADGQRVPRRRDDSRRPAGLLDAVAHEARGSLEVARIAVAGRDRRDPKPRVQLVEQGIGHQYPSFAPGCPGISCGPHPRSYPRRRRRRACGDGRPARRRRRVARRGRAPRPGARRAARGRPRLRAGAARSSSRPSGSCGQRRRGRPSASWSRTTRRRASSPRPRRGSCPPAPPSATCRRAASPTDRGSTPRPTSSASAPMRWRCCTAAASWRSRPRRSASACRRRATAPNRSRSQRGDELDRDDLIEALVTAGYERVDAVDDRGQVSVRGDIVDVFPSTGQTPLRIELFGDEIERLSTYSLFTQRSLEPLAHATIYPAAEQLAHDADLEAWERDEEGRQPVPAGLVPLLDELAAQAALAVWEPGPVAASALEHLEEVGAHLKPAERGKAYARGDEIASLIARSGRLDPLATGADAARGPAAGARGTRAVRVGERAARARRVRPARARRLPASRRCRARDHRASPRRCARARRRRPPAAGARRLLLRLARAPRLRLDAARPRAAARGPGLPPPGAADDGAAPRSRPRELRGSAAGRSRGARGSRRRAVPALRRQDRRRRHPRLRRAPVPRRGQALRPARPARQGHALRRRRLARARRSRGSAARRGRRSRRGRASPSTSSPASCSRCTRSARRTRAIRTSATRAGWRGSRRRSPTPRPRIRRARSRR